MDRTPVSAEEWDADAEMSAWRHEGDHVEAAYRADSFTGAGQLAAAIAAAADELDHHPDLSLAYPGVVSITLTTHSAGGVTRADRALALRIGELAAALGAVPEP